MNAEQTRPAAQVHGTVIRRRKDSCGYELADLSSCCQKSLVYFNDESGVFVNCYKFDDGSGIRRCAECNRRVDG